MYFNRIIEKNRLHNQIKRKFSLRIFYIARCKLSALGIRAPVAHNFRNDSRKTDQVDASFIDEFPERRYLNIHPEGHIDIHAASPSSTTIVERHRHPIKTSIPTIYYNITTAPHFATASARAHDGEKRNPNRRGCKLETHAET